MNGGPGSLLRIPRIRRETPESCVRGIHRSGLRSAIWAGTRSGNVHASGFSGNSKPSIKVCIPTAPGPPPEVRWLGWVPGGSNTTEPEDMVENRQS